MQKYLPYTTGLEALALRVGHDDELVRRAALDGEAGRELAKNVCLKTRRKFGAFFTGSNLADRLVSGRRISGKIFDPTVGAGDLLLAAGRKLQLQNTLRKTVASWSKQLAGLDLHKEFVRATKARLVLLARSRGEFAEELTATEVRNAFPLIRVGDALKDRKLHQWADLVLINPPFVKRVAPPGCTWGAGSVNSAAIFCDHALTQVRPGTKILAVLPEVLRSGTNYEAWRRSVASRAFVRRSERVGLFDNLADVDVFIAHFVRRPRPLSIGATWQATASPRRRVGRYFTVNVGAVVPHRDRKEGGTFRYLDARGALPWRELSRLSERRQFAGRVFQPPFIVIKRTSRPGDVYRATAALVRGNSPVAVENHLIVCSPHDTTLTRCRSLLRQLRSQRVNNWLNRSIRCRHLTVSSVASIRLA
jgi:hypothetical protein